MKQRALRLQKIPLTPEALKLTPWTAAGMTVGAEVAQPEPAAIRTAVMGAKVPRRVDAPRPSVRRCHRLRPQRRRRHDDLGFGGAAGARRLLGQARKRCWLSGTVALGLAGLWLDGPLRGGDGSVRLGQLKEKEQPYQGNQHELVAQELRHHRNVPLSAYERGPFY